MLPENVSVRPDQVDCPAEASESPIPYDETTALADVLRLYDGDLISVRFTVESLGSPVPDALSFTAEWPQQVVGDAVPNCVFIITNDDASVSHEPNGPGATTFELTGLAQEVPTTVEVWLVATDAADGATFASIVTPEEVHDADIVDPVGGRLRVVRRGSSAAAIDLDVSLVDVELERRSVVAEVSNPNPTARALDVRLELDAPGLESWEIEGDVPDDVVCTDASTLQCEFGDLDDDDVITLTAILTSTEQPEPRAVSCEGAPGWSGFGFCIEAVTTAGVDQTIRSSASWLAEVSRSIDADLVVTVDPDPVIATLDELVDITFSVTSNVSSDLGSVRIVGSDCSTVERIEQTLDDADAFLEPGETWQYACSLALPDSRVFRFDVAAIDQSGSDRSATYEDFAVVIDPELVISSRFDGSRELFDVTNTGQGVLFDLAFGLPGCQSIALVSGDPDVVAEGDIVTFACDNGAARAEEAIAYATGSDGSRFSSTS